jgi:acetylornithine deacetylase/succinyl-diaminopimelate desuccinylase-like protein
MIDERQFQIGGSCTYHTTTTIDMINISLAENANSIPGRCSFSFYFHFNIYLSSASCNSVVEKYIAWNQTKIFSS